MPRAPYLCHQHNRRFPMKSRFIPLSTWWWMVLIPILALLPCTAMAKEATHEEQLLQAAAQGDAVRIKTLLNRGADVNANNYAGRRPSAPLSMDQICQR